MALAARALAGRAARLTARWAPFPAGGGRGLGIIGSVVQTTAPARLRDGTDAAPAGRPGVAVPMPRDHARTEGRGSVIARLARLRLRGRAWASLLLVSGSALAAGAVAADAGQMQLLMFERDGCSYCRRWNEEIGPAYPNTPEGAAAPLRRLQIKAPLPPDVRLTGRPPAFTPTFVLTDDGTEVGRIEGYAGDQFFWALLDDVMAKAGWTPEAAPPAAPAPAASAPGEAAPPAAPAAAAPPATAPAATPPSAPAPAAAPAG